MFDKHKASKESSPEAPEPRVTPPPSSAAPAGSPDKVAMIGRGISVSGDVTADSNLRVEGVIEGRSVQSSHDVEVAESGRVVAGIDAKVVKIAGEVIGDINGSEKVMIARSGRVQGNVVAPRVQLEDGALFRGSIDMQPAAESKPAASKPTAVDSGTKGPAGQAAETAMGGPRKDSGLTLKSG